MIRPKGATMLRRFRLPALLLVVGGAAASLALMFRTAHPPTVLAVMFIGWVTSPFAAIAAGLLLAPRWPRWPSRPLYVMAVIVTAGALAAYSHLIPMPAGSRPAAVFLIVPFVSWLLLLAGLALAAVLTRRHAP